MIFFPTKNNALNICLLEPTDSPVCTDDDSVVGGDGGINGQRVDGQE